MNIERFKPLRFWSHTQCTEAGLVADVMGCCPCYTFPLPTECVLMAGRGFPSPQMGRVFYASEWAGRDVNDNGPGQYRSDACRFIVEVYEDNGDDGHTDYSLMGYALMTMNDAGRYVDLMRKATDVYVDMPRIDVEY